jgi:hypothetical protein
MPHQLKDVVVGWMLVMVVTEVDVGGNLALVLAAVVAVTMPRRWCRIRDSKPVVRQPIDGMICRLVVAIHIARRARVGICYLRRGGPRYGRRSPYIRPAAVRNIVSRDVSGVTDVSITRRNKLSCISG